MKQILIFLGLIISTLHTLTAQPQVEMADTFRQDGKIYVVLAVIAIIFVGMLVYMIRLDVKIRKLEKQEAE